MAVLRLVRLGGGANPSVARVSEGVARAKYGDPGDHTVLST